MVITTIVNNNHHIIPKTFQLGWGISTVSVSISLKRRKARVEAGRRDRFWCPKKHGRRQNPRTTEAKMGTAGSDKSIIYSIPDAVTILGYLINKK
jgi:hypothetical protein